MVQNGFKYALSGELRFLISIFTSFKTKFTRCFFPKVILVLFLFHKHSLCNPEELKCISKSKQTLEESLCLPNCDGLLITSYLKSEIKNKESFKHFLTKIAEEYDNYKGKYKFPSSLKGNKIL